MRPGAFWSTSAALAVTCLDSGLRPGGRRPLIAVGSFRGQIVQFVGLLISGGWSLDGHNSWLGASDRSRHACRQQN